MYKIHIIYNICNRKYIENTQFKVDSMHKIYYIHYNTHSSVYKLLIRYQ